MDQFPEFVLKYMNFTGKCFRHCEKPTTMKVVSQNSDRLVGAYVCPDVFVSQVVYFSTQPDSEWFERMLRAQVGPENINHRDIRIASRHGWELGGDAQAALRSKLGEGGVIHEVYWTRYPKTEEQKQQAVSLCVGDASKAGCMKLFMHNRNSVERLCPSCKAKNGNRS
jgi:hypothetical protein